MAERSPLRLSRRSSLQKRLSGDQFHVRGGGATRLSAVCAAAFGVGVVLAVGVWLIPQLEVVVERGSLHSAAKSVQGVANHVLEMPSTTTAAVTDGVEAGAEGPPNTHSTTATLLHPARVIHSRLHKSDLQTTIDMQDVVGPGVFTWRNLLMRAPDATWDAVKRAELYASYMNMPATPTVPSLGCDVVFHVQRGERGVWGTIQPINTALQQIRSAHQGAQLCVLSRGAEEDFQGIETRPNLTLVLNESDEVTFYRMVTAPVLVTGRSSLSYCAALLNQSSQIYYCPYFHRPLAHWTVLPNPADRTYA